MEFHDAERQDRRGRRLLSIAILAVAVVLGGAWVGLVGFLSANAAMGTVEDLHTRYIPDVEVLALDLPRVSQLSEVYTADGVRLGFLTERNSQPVALEEIPDTVVYAVLAAEDSGYFEHEGLDFRGVFRAALVNARGGDIQGGSTITQQIVKQTFGTAELTLERKIREAVVAVELERRYTKEELLEFYINSVFFGNNAYGVKAATEEYWGKELSEVTLAEAAAMVTAVRNPTEYDMRRFPSNVIRARNAVLDNMAEEGFITTEAAEAAKAEPLRPVDAAPEPELAPQVMIAAREALLDDSDDRYDVLGETFADRKKALFGCPAADTACELSGGLKGGLRVTVTVDLGLQEEAERVLREALPTDPELTLPTGAIAMVDNRTGATVVMATGVEFGDDLAAGQRPYDIAGEGQRNPGSSFKPIGLIAAMESGRRFDAPITLGTYWDSAPQVLDYDGAPKPWRCNNAGGGGGGLRSLEEATVFSINAVFCQVAVATGGEAIKETAHRLGIRSDIPPVPSLVLGTGAVSPLEMAQAYSTIANYGTRVEPYIIERIEDRDGNVIYEHAVAAEQVVEPALAASVVRTLEQVVSRGTATRANIGRPQAGKTGTHQDFRDVWFMGFIPQYTTAVWVGYPDTQEPLRNITVSGNFHSRAFGGTVAAPIWRTFMEIATEGLPVEDFPTNPEGMSPYYDTPKTEVPPVGGLSVGAYMTRVRQAGLNPVRNDTPSAEPVGTILGVSPAPGSKVRQGAAVTISVSTGIPTVQPMINIIGFPPDQAAGLLDQFSNANGYYLKWSIIQTQTADPALYGLVVSTSPAPGQAVGYESVVSIFVGGP